MSETKLNYGAKFIAIYLLYQFLLSFISIVVLIM